MIGKWLSGTLTFGSGQLTKAVATGERFASLTFLVLSLWRLLPVLESRTQCVFHIISLCLVLTFFWLQGHCIKVLAPFTLCVVCLQSWQYSTAVDDFQERVFTDLLLGQMVLLSTKSLRWKGLVLWTTVALLLCFWPVDKAFPRAPDLVSLVTAPLCSWCSVETVGTIPSDAKIEVSEAKVHQCLKLVLQHLRVPLQLAINEGEKSQGQRLQQIWDLLTGLDQQLESQFTNSVIRAGKNDRVRARERTHDKVPVPCVSSSQKAMAVWCGAPEPTPCDGSASSKPGVPEEAKDSKDSVPLSPQSGSRNVKEDKEAREAALLEVSTSIGSMGHWDVLPDTVRMEVEIDLERDSMPITEVKFRFSPEERDAVHLKDLFAEEDFENFRNWLEPEVNRSIHGTAIGESTSCALKLPFIGGKVNGILTVDGGLNDFRLRCSMSQLSAQKGEQIR